MSNNEFVFTPAVLNDLRSRYGEVVTTGELKEYGEEIGNIKIAYQARTGLVKVKRGTFRTEVPSTVPQTSVDVPTTQSTEVPTMVTLTPSVSSEEMSEVTDTKIPNADPAFVPFGFFSDLKKVVQSNTFVPVYVSGDSGNGKTHMVEQLGAKLKIPVIILNVSKATTEDEMIGGFRLLDGNTVWKNGPVLDAYEMSRSGKVILLLDEVDQASIDIMCLQTILQGRPYTVKQTGVTVTPNMENLNIVATGNTSGQGDSTDRFIGAEVMNEAFLERFAAEFKHEYPTPAVERKILGNLIPSASENFLSTLVEWARTTRETYKNGGSENFITTRRLTHIAKLYDLFGDGNKAITFACNRFEDETRDSFLSLFQALYSEEEQQSIDVVTKEGDEPVTVAPELEINI